MLWELALSALAAAQVSAPARQAETDPPAVVLITFEGVRPDHLGSLGWHRETSPELDRFFASAVVFERAFTASPASTAGHLSILTASEVPSHGLSILGIPRTPWASTPERRSAAEVLASRKWRCAAFVSSKAVGTASGLGAGFYFVDGPDTDVRDPAEVATRVERWLDVHGKERFFLWLHFEGALEPHRPADPYLTMFHADEGVERAIERAGVSAERFNQGGFANSLLIKMFFPELDGQVTPKGVVLPRVEDQHLRLLYDRYDGDVRATDAAIGRVLAKLDASGVSRRAVVALASVSGMAFGEHATLGRAEVTTEIAHVFAAVRAPGLAPARSSAVVSLVDLLPTALARTDAADALSGRDGIDVLQGGREYALSVRPTREGERNPPGPIYALYGERWKFVHRPEQTDQLFDLGADPLEASSVLKEHPEVAAAMLGVVKAKLAPRAK
jgi:arylsulfatase A-like enzyme